jgi:mono/diheme cytochrome c family protein
MSQPDPSDTPLVRGIQLGILGVFTVFGVGIVVWVVHLLRVAVQWQDSFSASVAVSLVAIPVFLVILGLIHYLFWGLRRHRHDPMEEQEEEGASTRKGGGAGNAATALVVGALLLHGSARVEAQPSLPQNPMRGWSVFVEKDCDACHSVRGAGGTRAPDLGLIGRNQSGLELVGTLWNSGPHMAAAMGRIGLPYPKISTAEMESLLPFIYILGYFDPPPDVERGERIYDRSPCKSCHGERGEGSVGPSLASVASGASAVELAAGIWNHGPAMARETRRLGLAFPAFAGSELLDMVGYLRTVAIPSDEPLRLQPVGNPQRGMRLLESRGCMGCHAVDGKGGRGGPDFGLAEDLARSQTLLVTAMWNHGPSMWAGMRAMGRKVPTFTEQEMVDVVSALFFTRFGSRGGDVAAGERLVAAKGCGTCHTMMGQTEGSALEVPDLGSSQMLESDYAVASAVWNHLPGMYTVMEDQSRAWPSFEPGEFANLIAYLRSLQR